MMIVGGVAAVYFLNIPSKCSVALTKEIFASMMILFSTKFRSLPLNKNKLHSVCESSSFMPKTRDDKLAKRDLYASNQTGGNAEGSVSHLQRVSQTYSLVYFNQRSNLIDCNEKAINLAYISPRFESFLS